MTAHSPANGPQHEGDSLAACTDLANYVVKAGRRSFYGCHVHLSNVVDQGLDHVFALTAEAGSVAVTFLADGERKVCDAVA